MQMKYPKSIEKSINELARSREKAAKHKYLLDLGESLVMHLCSFVLGEYKGSGIVSVELEKTFFRNKNNIPFGVYLGWIRDASNYMNGQKSPSKLHQLLHGSNQFPELATFILSFDALKENILKQKSESFGESIQKALEEKLKDTNLYDFLNIVLQLRNKVAHPHIEVNGKIVTWPFSDEYFDATNPFLEKALNRAINELVEIWEFRQYVVDSNEDGLLVLKDEDDEELKELEIQTDFPNGIKLFVHQDDTILLSDWKLLLKAGDEAIEKIRAEEEALRNKIDIDELKLSIKSALSDQQISLEELNFFSSLARTKLGLSKQEVKTIILEVAKKEGIDDPFPDVDKRFINMIDNAIDNRTYNEFLLKLAAQQYGVDSEDFDKIFEERTFILNVDPDEVRKNKVFQMTLKELKVYQDLMRAHQWIYTIGLYSSNNKESQYKMVSGNSDVFGTKEYFHKNAFVAVENFVQMRIEKIAQNPEDWQFNVNQWQQGNLSGYAWCSIYLENNLTRKMLALDIAINNKDRLSGDVLIGFLPDWKDLNKIQNFGLLKAIFTKYLEDFAQEYETELEKYPNLKMWDTVNFRGNYSLIDIYRNFKWFFKYLYSLDEIQFVIPMQEVIENPGVIQENFDIAFNLFSGLFEGVIRDYENLLDNEYAIQKEELAIRKCLLDLQPLFENYGLQKVKEVEVKDEESRETVEIGNDGLIGAASRGVIATEFRTREESYPLLLNFAILQDFDNQSLYFRIYVSCAGYVQPKLHLSIEKVLESMVDLKFNNASFYFMRSKLVAVLPIEDISNFSAVHFSNFFLKELSERCAYSHTPFQTLKINNPDLMEFEVYTRSKLTALHESLASLFKNKISMSRNWMQGYRFLDKVDSSKGAYHWLGWGLFFQNDKLYAGVVFGISNSLTGASFKEQMEIKAAHSDWVLESKGEAEESEKFWTANSLRYNQFKAKSEFNKNHTARHATIQNERSCWKPLKQDSNQWIQIELDETMEVHAIKLLGAPNGGGWVTQFNLRYSTDGKKWQEMNDLQGCLSPNEPIEINFPMALSAKYIQIQPVLFEKSIALRLDILVKKIVPTKMELQYLQPVSNLNELEKVFDQIQSRLEEIKLLRGIWF